MATHASILAGKTQGRRSLVSYSPWGGRDWTRLGTLHSVFQIKQILCHLLPPKRYPQIFSLRNTFCEKNCIWRVTGKNPVSFSVTRLGVFLCIFSIFVASGPFCKIQSNFCFRCISSLPTLRYSVVLTVWKPSKSSRSGLSVAALVALMGQGETPMLTGTVPFGHQPHYPRDTFLP